MSLHKSTSENCADPFIFKDLPKSEFNQLIADPISVETKPSANQHIPTLADFSFAPCYLPKTFETCAGAIRGFNVREDDVWLTSAPKTGTTLTHTIVYQLKNGLDVNRKLYSFMRDSLLENDMIRVSANALEKMKTQPSPRMMKSHLPPNLLPIELWTIQPKIIYIARNPKDVAISMYHMMKNYAGGSFMSLQEYLDRFLEDKILYGNYIAHVLSFWQLRHLENLLFLTYEELTSDLFRGVKKIADFLECKWNEDDLKKLSEYVTFKNMRKVNEKEIIQNGDGFQEAKNRFFRKGKAGGYVDEMSKEYIERFDQWTAECLNGSGLKFEI